MTKEQFDSYIENMKVAEELKKCWKEIHIDWETDPEKINLSQVASASMFESYIKENSDNVKYSIEIVKMEDIQQNSAELFGIDFMRFVELYKIIKSGIKIIPPLVTKGYSILDGEICLPSHSLPIICSDGEHRVRLCRHLDIKDIPILIVYKLEKYVFTKTMWDIECDGLNIILSHKEIDKSFTIPLESYSCVPNIDGNYAFYQITNN